ncbi:E set domain-containing protein [Blastocystis sp. ATCC 50177/Nand II]|uniref:E set domain-containing protein n=1 Tax=Blastocystis sp. subtype 1 (strain ATCC 50177 / NandII) TaxID=478820 RepID=A0A196S9F6_BLAHN|nr:E set domain-containing protein [Blastocystis sp. ATCC 50177/Nand II]
MILDSDVSLQSQKAYFFQITLPKDIPPSLKTNCVRYFHLLSFCFFDKKSESHFISIPLNEYRDRASITVTEQPKPSTTIPLSEAIPLEFDALYQIDVNQSSEDAKWANSRFITSYPDFMSATPNAANAGDMESLSRRPQTHIGIFTVTHNGESLCNVQLTADPIIHGDVIQMVADFSDVQIPCEQMTISLYYEEYSAYLRGKIVRSDLVSTISVMTRHIQKYPYSFSIPVVYPPTLQTEQVRIGWKLQFSFLFLKKREKEAKEEYVFDPEQFLSQAMTKVDWSYEVKVRSCVNERFNDALTEECELNGREYAFLV